MIRSLTAIAVLGMAIAVRAQTPDIGPPPGILVDVGGRRLHLLCSGQGSPTVVLEAGASSFAIDWTLVQQDVARSNRVCAYDRAGYGWSDPAPPPDSGDVPRDLRTLLSVAKEPGPYVLVGASRGGIHVRSYSADYPDDVLGLVLVDPSNEDGLFIMFDGPAVALASLTAEQMRTTFTQRTVRPPRRSPQTGAPFDKLPAALYELRVKLDQRLIASTPDTLSAKFINDFREAERAALARLLQQRKSMTHPLGSRPLVVLTRGVDSSEGLVTAQAGVARLSSNSRHTVVPESGHEIHLFRPEFVVQAISDVVESIRTGRTLPQR